MKILLAAVALASTLVSAPAQDAEKKSNPQNNRMVACQKEAGDQKRSQGGSLTRRLALRWMSRRAALALRSPVPKR